jgi:hypothetical protein
MTQPAWRRRLLELLFPALLAPLQLGLFGTHTIYANNLDEFSAPFGGLLVHLILPVLGLAVLLVAIGLLLPARLFRGYVVLLFAIGLTIWIQGNLLVANYGPLDGGTIDWSAHDSRTPYEIALWVTVPVVALLASRVLFPAAVFGSRVLLSLQAVLLGISLAQGSAGARWRGPSEAMFDVSTTRNAFHIVLDSFHSDLFMELVEKERATIDRGFAGFVFFADNSGAFPTTMVSIPAMLTGTVYRNEVPLQEYISTHFRKGSLFRALRDQHYRVDSITEMTYDIESATNFFRMPRPYVPFDEYTRFAAWQLADLSLFRHVPHILRPRIYNGQKWRLQSLMVGRTLSRATNQRRHHSGNGERVLAQFTERMKPAVDGPVYKFMHVGVPHPPVTLRADCSFVEPQRFTRESYAGQTRCAVARITALLDRLRELNLYDSSLIVLASDHGVRLPPRQFEGDRLVPGGGIAQIAGRAMSLLLVKPPHATGPVRVSYAPTAITDIPATVLDALGLQKTLPGEPALKLHEAARRERQFANYVWENDGWGQPYFEHLDLFRINGPVRHGGSWAMIDTLYAPGTDSSARTRGLADPHRSSSGVVYRWSDPAFFLHSPPEARGFELTMRSIAAAPQEVTIRIGETILERITLRKYQWITVRHPLAEAPDRSRVWVELRVAPPFKPGRGSLELGVQTRDLKWF